MRIRFLAGFVLSVILEACGGGGGGGSNNPPPPPAPSSLSYPTPPDFTVGTTITALTPTVTGTPTAYAVTPALPAGLSLNGTTGAITGTPTAVAATSNYQVTASNGGGSTTTAVSITVRDVAPAFTYPSASYVFSTDSTITALVPTTTGGAVTQWSVSPALPSGLALDASNGHIAGTPTQAVASAAYTVTASNTGGTSSFMVDITVENGVLLELGHSRPIDELQYSGTRAVSHDASDHVAIWNSQTGALIFKADAGSCATVGCGRHIALAGNTMVIRSAAGFAVRSATDGSLLANIDSPAVPGGWWLVADDGSYVCAGNGTAATAWLPNGTVLFTRPGNYANAHVYAAPGEIRIAAGAAGTNVIEYLAVPSGASSLSPTFSGTFHSWFTDGDRFFANTGNALYVYSRLAAQLSLLTLPSLQNLGGRGEVYWASGGGNLSFYAVTGTSAPIAAFTIGSQDTIVPSSDSVGIFPHGDRQVSVISLVGGTPTLSTYSLPIAYLQSFAANSPTDWLIGNVNGVLIGSAPGGGSIRHFSLGRALSIAGGPARFGVATASGSIFLFDTATKAPAGEIPFASSDIQISDDGAVLGAQASTVDAQFSPDRTLRVYSVPAGSVLAEWPATLGVGTDQPIAYSLSRSGNLIAQIRSTASLTQLALTANHADGSPAWSALGVSQGGLTPALSHQIAASPDGSHVAVTLGDQTANSTTLVYTNGSLTGAIGGWLVGALDDSRLLVNRYQPHNAVFEYQTSEIHDYSGQLMSSVDLNHDLRGVSRAGANGIYDASSVAIWDMSSGAQLWASPQGSATTQNVGAVAGARVIFAAKDVVRAEHY